MFHITGTAYPTPTSTPTYPPEVTGRLSTHNTCIARITYTTAPPIRGLIPQVSLGAVLAIVICLYALTTIILVLRIKILSKNPRQYYANGSFVRQNCKLNSSVFTIYHYRWKTVAQD